MERADHPAGMPAFVISKPLVDGAAREVVLESVTLDRWRADVPRALREIGAEVIGSAASGMGLALLVARPGGVGGRGGERGAALGWRRRRARLRGRRARGPIRRHGVAQRRELRLIGPAMTSHSVLKPQPRPEILAIDPYVPGKSHAPGAAKVHKLSSNESPLGPSPKAIEAVRAHAGSLELYPDGASTALREAIGRRYGLDPARIICGNGSDELLALLAHVFLHPGDEGLYSQYGFLTYPICIRAAGGIPVVAKETDRTASVDAILAKASARTKIVYLANPSNPTGTYIPFSEVKRLHAGLPPHTLLVIDAAYAEYVTRNDYAAGLELASTSDNVVMTRTFSKDPWSGGFAHRLGLRLGACSSTRSTASAGHSI